MKSWLMFLITLPLMQLAAADASVFARGDYVFVKAQLIGCGSTARYVEAGQTGDGGYVTLFNDIAIAAEGNTAIEIGTRLADLLELKTGHRPKTIEIVRVPADDAKKAALLMMLIHDERSRDCEVEKQRQNVPDWIGEFQIA